MAVAQTSPTTPTVKKIVLAYSGGLDTSVILPWLKDNYPGCKVIAFAAELGQGDELEGIKQKALASGADKCIVKDLRQEFAEQYCFPMLKSGAVYESKYLLGTSIARPLIAKYQVEVAHAEGADAVAHGATGKGNDQVRFELTYMALGPELKIIAPWKDDRFQLRSREAAIEYAMEKGVPIAQTKKKIYSRDRNLWHISHEGADLEDPRNEPKDDLWVMSVPVSKAPNRPEYVEIKFEAGIPVAVNGKKMKGHDLIATLNEMGGKHAVGQTDLVENRLVGMKSRGAYETPGGTILYTALTALEHLTIERDTLHFKQQVALKYADLVYYGQWFHPLREALDVFINKTQEATSGTVKVKLFKGSATVASTDSANSLYQHDLASFTMGAEYDGKDAIGFIKLFGLPMKVHALRNKRK
ncbi:MAG TPA: argininosuccinate synthase [Phycisphaerae bacterium]|nr:argininosuccinate synthase [Phycisphaerae bacterium]